MIKWAEIPNLYKAAATLVLATAFLMTYHEQFVTEAEAMEVQTKAEEHIIKLRVDNKKTEKRALIREKRRAVTAGDVAEQAVLEADIETLRREIASLCSKVKDCGL